jgi:hypothetical protein
MYEDEAVTNQTSSENCSHPRRGGQEHILSSGTGDYHCHDCDEAMPIIGKPDRCMLCGSATAQLVPDPTHGNSWHCPDCGKNWGWVRH